MRSLLPVLLLACSGGSAPDEALPERTFLEPLEEINLAPPVPRAGEDPTPEAIAFTSGFDLGQFHHYSHMRGWVHADAQLVWEALREPDVMVDRRVIDSYIVKNQDFRPDVDFSWVFASDMTIQGREIEFDITWLHTVDQGELEAPELVVARWDMTDGPDFIDRISGSIELEAVEPGLTEIRGIFHMRAFPQGTGSMEQYWKDLHADVLAVLDGEPVSTYD